MIANLNVKFISNKSDSISFMIKNNAVILFISKTKLDVSFQSIQIKILALSMSYLYDRDSSGGYIRDDIPTKLLKYDFWTKRSYQKIKLIAITKNDNIKFCDDVSNLALDQFDVNNFKKAIFSIIW